jgi:hypothetical protein
MALRADQVDEIIRDLSTLVGELIAFVDTSTLAREGSLAFVMELG